MAKSQAEILWDWLDFLRHEEDRAVVARRWPGSASQDLEDEDVQYYSRHENPNRIHNRASSGGGIGGNPEIMFKDDPTKVLDTALDDWLDFCATEGVFSLQERKAEGQWIGVDLDGTLAEYHAPYEPVRIGAPIRPMVERVRRWLAEGKTVKIFTVRHLGHTPEMEARIVEEIMNWCAFHLGKALPVTASKDPQCVQYWDDRAVSVERNTGRFADANI